MQGISVCLGFKDKAEEAVNFYVSVFKDSKILKITRYGKDQHGPEGSVCTVAFMLNGQRYLAVNGGSDMFNFTYGMSLMVECDDQAEIDYLWDKLIEGGGNHEVCGWVKDRFGLSWQILPASFNRMMKDATPEQVQSIFKTVWQMKKLDAAKIEEAYKKAA